MAKRMKSAGLLLLAALVLPLVFFLTGSRALAFAGSTVNPGEKCSLEIYKYNLTKAQADGVWYADQHPATGEEDPSVRQALGSTYALRGVRFRYLKIGELDTAAGISGASLVYRLPRGEPADSFLGAVRLTAEKAQSTSEEAYFFTAQTLLSALSAALQSDPIPVKNTLEALVTEKGGTEMEETDALGHTKAADLPQGLYLLVETAVPEKVAETTDPFLVSLPMTDASGSGWNYHVVVYPKNKTGAPTLDKQVRESVNSSGRNQGSEGIADGYAHVISASFGDVLEYQILSTLPVITSSATRLTRLLLEDVTSYGQTYTGGDVEISFYEDPACTRQIVTWPAGDSRFAVTYGDDTHMEVTITETGLAEINSSDKVYGPGSTQTGYSGCTMRVTYTGSMDSWACLGTQGNINSVNLTWRRTNEKYSSMLSHDCHVHAWGLSVQKEFSDRAGDMARVRFLLHNDSDSGYVTAEPDPDPEYAGTYHVTGLTKEVSGATEFTPNDDGFLIIRGMEADEYSLSELQTDDGYALLKEPIKVVITGKEYETDGPCSSCGDYILVADATVNGQPLSGEEDDLLEDEDCWGSLVPIKVVNMAGFTLPQTGKRGTWIFTCTGIVGMALLAVLFVRSRKDRKP